MINLKTSLVFGTRLVQSCKPSQECDIAANSQ